MAFYEAVAPIRVNFFICGLNARPFYKVKSKVTRNFLSVALVALVGLAAIFVDHYNAYYGSINEFLFTLQLVFCTTFIASSYLRTYTDDNRLCSIVKWFVQVDARASKRSLWSSYVTAYCFLLARSAYYVRNFNNPKRGHFTNITGSVAYVLGANLYCFIFFVLRELRRTVSTCRKDLNKIFTDFRQVVGVLVLQRIVICYVYLVAALFMLCDCNFDRPLRLGFVPSLVIIVVEVVALVYYAEALYMESAKTALLYENALKKHDRKLSKRGMFYLQVQFERNEFSVCGLFTINWNFLLGMFGSVVSNLIILLQFNKLNSTTNSVT